jgi:hypothetical protein
MKIYFCSCNSSGGQWAVGGGLWAVDDGLERWTEYPLERQLNYRIYILMGGGQLKTAALRAFSGKYVEFGLLWMVY